MQRTQNSPFAAKLVILSSLGLAFVAQPTHAAIPVPGTTQVVSVLGTDYYNSHGARPSISADGRFVAFASGSIALVQGDTNGVADVFVKDIQNGTIERVSVSTGGVEANSTSGLPAISPDGNYVVFVSTASNLVSGDTNGESDVFVHDRGTGTTERVSVDSDENQANGGSVNPSALSFDGRFVAFSSYATNLVTGDTNAAEDVFVRDRVAGTTERVSVRDGAGVQAETWSFWPGISYDGRYVTFTYNGYDLAPPFTNDNGLADVYVRDRVAGTTKRASVASNGVDGDYGYTSTISGDGRFVAFHGGANLVPGDTNDGADVFVKDMQTGDIERVSVDSNGGQANYDSIDATISGDGRFVAFSSGASNLVAIAPNSEQDVFIHDRQTGTTQMVSVNYSGTGGGEWYSGGDSTGVHAIAVNHDGSLVAFTSGARDLVEEDDDFHGQNVFIRGVVINRAPVVSCGNPIVLWEPNHQLVDVSAVFTVEDPDGDDVTLSFTVYSDETETPETGDGTGRHAPDFKNESYAGGRGLLLRSERRGNGNGRFYLLVVTADDGNGGITTDVCVAAVAPHDPNPVSLAAVLAEAAAAAAAAQDALDNALPIPAGLYLDGVSAQLGPFQ